MYIQAARVISCQYLNAYASIPFSYVLQVAFIEKFYFILHMWRKPSIIGYWQAQLIIDGTNMVSIQTNMFVCTKCPS